MIKPTNPAWVGPLLITVCVLLTLIYFGIGVILYLGSQAEDEEKWTFWRRAKFMFGWLPIGVWILCRGIPESLRFKRFRKNMPKKQTV